MVFIKDILTRQVTSCFYSMRALSGTKFFSLGRFKYGVVNMESSPYENLLVFVLIACTLGTIPSVYDFQRQSRYRYSKYQ